MTDTHVMRIQQTEVDAIKKIAAGEVDPPMVMLNQNRYSADAGYPDGSEYRTYLAVIEQTIARVGGQLLWRTPVLGQPVGCGHDEVHEILAVWYPSHRAFLELSTAEGAQDMYQRRERCVENAVLHRCPGSAYPLRP